MPNQSPVMPSQPPRVPTSRAGFQDVDTLRNSSGMVAIISQRSKTRVLTFGVFRVWEERGEVSRTSFIPSSMSDAYLELVTLAIARVRELETSTDLPFGSPAKVRNTPKR